MKSTRIEDMILVGRPSASTRPVTMGDTMVQLAGALDGQAAPARGQGG